MQTVHRRIQDEIGPLLGKLQEAGFEIVESDYSSESFGNYYVDLSSDQRKLRIVKDRTQFILEGAREDLESFDLWRAHDDLRTFETAVLSYVGANT